MKIESKKVLLPVIIKEKPFEANAQREVTLPLYQSMADKDVHRVSDVIVEYFKETK